MSAAISIAPVRKSVIVGASPQRAFEVFTAQLDRWWPKSHSIGAAPIQQSIIEPFVGGRWYTQHADGTESVVGHVREWQPGQRLVVSWEISAAWKPDARIALASEVEVRFVAEAEGATMRNAVDNGWPGLLTLFTNEVARNPELR
jgi:uncharacterized protein YndB with AHSA1/START domain